MSSYSRLRRYLAQRELEPPVLCLLMSHRPLVFVAGQLLYLLEPILGLLGFSEGRTWARVLSETAFVSPSEADLGETRAELSQRQHDFERPD